MWYGVGNKDGLEGEYMKIYDCFTFYNEFALLEWRLKMLYDLVDCFVIVEAGQTYQGKPKPYNFEMRAEEFARYSDKIRYVKADKVIENPGKLDIEIYQRNCIMQGLDGCAPDDIVIIGDLDEIPSPELIKDIRENRGNIHTFSCFGNVGERSGVRGLSRNFRCFLKSLNAIGSRGKIVDFLRYSPIVCEQRMFEFFVDYERTSHWCGTIVLMYKDLTTPQEIRDRRNRLPMVLSGWHFSSMGGVDAIKVKFHSTSDGVDNPLLKLPKEEQDKFIYKELADRHIWWLDEEMKCIPITDDDIPYIEWFVKKYPQMSSSALAMKDSKISE